MFWVGRTFSDDISSKKVSTRLMGSPETKLALVEKSLIWLEWLGSSIPSILSLGIVPDVIWINPNPSGTKSKFMEVVNKQVVLENDLNYNFKSTSVNSIKRKRVSFITSILLGTIDRKQDIERLNNCPRDYLASN